METSIQNGVNTNGQSSMETWEEVELPVPWGVIAGKWWGSRNKQPILALHGWQDNAGTFDRLCPLLPKDTSIFCIDLPGHGKSTHYPTGMQYFLFWDGIALVRRIVKHFNWTDVTLMGHSLGGALSFMYAASFPTEVAKMICIDIAAPTIRDHHKTAAVTGDCIDKALKYETLAADKMPCYGYEEMLDIVVGAYDGSVDRESAKVMMRRGMSKVLPDDNGKTLYHFSRDLRLKVSVLGMFAKDQVLSYAERILAPVLNIRAVPGMKFDNEDIYMQVIESMRTSSKYVQYEEVPGTHHIHLNTPERIVKLIEDFLKL